METVMSQPTIRPHVVALLLGTPFPNPEDPATWTRKDGRPLTEEERAVMLSATPEELDAVDDQAQREADDWRDQMEVCDRIIRLVAPYFAQLTPDSTAGDLVKLLGEDDTLAALDEIADALAPDGSSSSPRRTDRAVVPGHGRAPRTTTSPASLRPVNSR
jgi:hypothetical protein